MSSITVHIPDALFSQVRLLASNNNDAIEQFALLAIAEKVSSLATADYIAERASRANIERFGELLAKVPDVEPELYDKML
ncbi:MAG: toxin-antitoxin system HicB family antitoxin [Candidatus Kapaibacterium sp.]|nr:MAG: toxin-antitoxin system HicB family antitoxin [Candidatus Kapabacteria bacterium]